MYLLNDNRYETVSFPKLATLAHKIKWIFVVSNFEYVEGKGGFKAYLAFKGSITIGMQIQDKPSLAKTCQYANDFA